MRCCLKSTEPGDVILIASAASTITGSDNPSSRSETAMSSVRLSASCVSLEGVVVNVRKGMPSSSSTSMRASRFWKKFIATRARIPNSSHSRKICFISSSFFRVTAKTISSTTSGNSPRSSSERISGTVP